MVSRGHEQRREYEAKKREERSDAEEKGEKTAVCGIRNLVYAEAHNMWCRVVDRLITRAVETATEVRGEEAGGGFRRRGEGGEDSGMWHW